MMRSLPILTKSIKSNRERIDSYFTMMEIATQVTACCLPCCLPPLAPTLLKDGGHPMI